LHIEKLSLYIITLNEEKRLPMVLGAAACLADEIVVVDSGSTDGTEAVARSYGARFLRHAWKSVDHQVKWAEEQCSNRWVLRLDADEVIPPDLADEIRRIREAGCDDAYYLKIADMVPGRERPNPLVKHYRLIRLYNRDAFTMSGEHGHDDVVKIKPDATTGRLGCFVHHYSYISIRQLVEKHNAESGLLAERAIMQGKNYSPWRMVGMMTLNFLKSFFLYRFFLYGFWGFILSVECSFMRFLKFAKFHERMTLEKRPHPPRHDA
jgi:glycosyltransferase involved in cell wall biosynthesis